MTSLPLLSTSSTRIFPQQPPNPTRGQKIDKLRFQVFEDSGLPPDEVLYVNGFTADYVEWDTVGTTPYLDAPDDGNYIEGTTNEAFVAWFSFENITLGANTIMRVVLEGYTNGPYNEDVDYNIFAPDLTLLGSLYATGEPAWVTPRWVLPEETVDVLYPEIKTQQGFNDFKVLIYFFDPNGYGGAGNILDALKLNVWVGIPRVHNTNTGLNYSTIQEAIDAPETLNGHTIFVEAGSYYENVVVDKSLSLIGENRSNTIVNGSLSGHAIEITANNVTLSNFTIQNGNHNIHLEHSNHSSIINNILITEGPYVDLGIYLSLSSFNTISGNTVTRKTRGIVIEGGSYNTISGNNITSNRDFGIRLGRYEMTSYNIISGNTITNHTAVSSAEGIKLMDFASNNTVYGNYIADNNYGFGLLSSSNNTLYHNNFIDNTQQVYIETPSYANFWDDGYPSGGNYWSDYGGVDEKGGLNQDEPSSDGIGDTSYIIDENNQDNYPLMNLWTQLIGDIDGDWDVDSDDLYKFSEAYGTGLGEPNYHTRADLDQNGDVDLHDFYIFARKYGKTKP